mmetsp:Transcript_994/g.2380  ORF Transcript_994/g.2380 Transcript_994/m.2380 type:complete len:201 (-) Transcript_994:156-758(-)
MVIHSGLPLCVQDGCLVEFVGGVDNKIALHVGLITQRLGSIEEGRLDGGKLSVNVFHFCGDNREVHMIGVDVEHRKERLEVIHQRQTVFCEHGVEVGEGTCGGAQALFRTLRDDFLEKIRHSHGQGKVRPLPLIEGDEIGQLEQAELGQTLAHFYEAHTLCGVGEFCEQHVLDHVGRRKHRFVLLPRCHDLLVLGLDAEL